MKNVEKNLQIGMKIFGIGCWLLAAKAYSEIRYYQGKIEVRTEMQDHLQKILDALEQSIEDKDEEA